MTKLKAFADDKLKVARMMTSLLVRVENTVGQGENAGYQHSLLFPKCFSKAFFFRVVKSQDSVVKSFITLQFCFKWKWIQSESYWYADKLVEYKHFKNHEQNILSFLQGYLMINISKIFIFLFFFRRRVSLLRLYNTRPSFNPLFHRYS